MTEIEVVDDGAVRSIFINRPGNGNALSYATMIELRAALEGAGASVRAVILSGRGKLFCAGGDVKEWKQKKDADPNYGGDNWAKHSVALIEAIAHLKKPVIAAVNGAAAGAGLDLACACDFRIAADTARFICSFTRIGYAPDAGGTWFLPRLIGLAKAKELIFHGEPWNAQQALACGLVDRVVPASELEAAALAWARKLAEGPTIAIGQAKLLLERSYGSTLAEQLEHEHQAASVCRATQDHKEGLAAAKEKRAPVFRGL
jgi:2-(1,2-epoxy-1,2-dihydrophenyl)acetyl-CoA isomerase